MAAGEMKGTGMKGREKIEKKKETREEKDEKKKQRGEMRRSRDRASV